MKSLIIVHCSSLPAELLLHFFHFYSAAFDFRKHVIAVHCPPNERLSIADACRLAEERRAEVAPPQAGKKISFAVSPVCMQDPFDLSHNLGKSFTKSSCKILVKRLKCAMYILREELQKGDISESGEKGGILALFHPSQYVKASSVLISGNPELSKIMVLTTGNIVNLLKRTEEMRKFVELLECLDPSDPDVAAKLTVVAVKALSVVLELDLGFICQPSAEEEVLQTSIEQSIGTFNSEMALTDPCGCLPEKEAGVDLSEGEEKVEEGGMEGEGGVGKKRQRKEGEEGESIKRAKLTHGSPLDTLDSAVAGVMGRYTCTAHTNWWLHRRKALRKLRKTRQRQTKREGVVATSQKGPAKAHQEDSTMTDQKRRDESTSSVSTSLVSLASSLPDLPPILQFYLSPHDLQSVDHTLIPEGGVVAINLTASDTLYAVEFSNFFAYFKKFVMHIPPVQ